MVNGITTNQSVKRLPQIIRIIPSFIYASLFNNASGVSIVTHHPRLLEQVKGGSLRLETLGCEGHGQHTNHHTGGDNDRQYAGEQGTAGIRAGDNAG